MEAINKMINFYKKAVLENYYNFEGRAGVGEYWWFFLANLIISVAISIVDSILASMIGMAVLGTIYSLAVFLPGLGAAVRRLHDMGKNGWWVLVPLYNIWLLIQPSEPKKNTYGDPVKK